MRVALELQPCCGNRSGIGIYTYELAKRLKDRDDLEFCGNIFNFCGRNDNNAALQDIKMPIVESHLFPYRIYSHIWNFAPVPYHSLFSQRVELSIFFNYIVPPGVQGKVMTVIHDLAYLRYPETLNKRNLKRIQKGIDYSLKRSDQILTVSSFSKKEIQTLLGISEERISVVYNAASCSKEIDEFSVVAEKYCIQKPYILYVGTIEPRKNLVRLIKAFQSLKRIYKIPHQLVLAGGKGWRTEAIYQAAEEADRGNEIVFTGYVTQGEKNSLYKNADVFVFPSLYEGFGIPPLEAMNFGCPVVCSNAASLPEVVGNAAELVDPLEEDSIAEGVWKVLSDQEYTKHLIQEGYAQTKKFTWENSAEKLTQVCLEVLGA